MAKYYDVIMSAPFECDIIALQPKSYDITATDRVWEADLITYFIPAMSFFSVINNIILNALLLTDHQPILRKHISVVSSIIIGAVANVFTHKNISSAETRLNIDAAARLLSLIIMSGTHDVITIAASAVLVARKHRRLYQMDDHTLSEFDSMTLETLDFVNIEG